MTFGLHENVRFRFQINFRIGFGLLTFFPVYRLGVDFSLASINICIVVLTSFYLHYYWHHRIAMIYASV